MTYYTQKDRLHIVLDIINNLKNYKTSNNTTINLYNDELCSFIKEFKSITNNYIKQDDNKTIKEFKGKLFFEEINKEIEYIFPAKKNKNPLFVIRF
tara:strand:+ start:18281 stop:18568 length:288 start_codon:yes stop_codon:yes gene_type:complete